MRNCYYKKLFKIKNEKATTENNINSESKIKTHKLDSEYCSVDTITFTEVFKKQCYNSGKISKLDPIKKSDDSLNSVKLI